MALTADASLVVTPDGSWNPDPPDGHAGWNNPSGDKTWVPDDKYARRVLLTLTGDAGEHINIVNWEIYDGTTIPFVDDASVAADASPSPTNDPAPGATFVNNRTTRTIWTRISDDPGIGNPFFEESGTAWVSTLRANGPRTVIEFPFYGKWGAADTETATYEVEAFLPGAFGTPSATTTITLTNPDIDLIGGVGDVQPRAADMEAEYEPQPDPLEAETVKPKKSRKKKADDEPLG